MPPLCIVPYSVISAHPNPVRNRAILLHFLSQLFLDPERLLGRHGAERADAHVDELECGEEEPAAANSSKRKPGRRTPE
jgi:hypothetical protein